MIKVSIIIVNYNTYNLLIDCIESIKTNTHNNLDYEIIVVDNNSPIRDIEKLPEVYQDVQLILSDENGGFGKANNLGSRLAKGEYLFFLNPDTLLLNDAISVLYNFISTNKNVAVCGANLYDENLQPANSFGQTSPGIIFEIDYFFAYWFSKKLFKNSVNFNYTEKPLEVRRTVSGASYMVKKFIFDEVNGFDEDFFMYYEENELSYRIKRKGFKIFSIPDAKIIHLEGKSEEVKERTLTVGFESRKNFFLKTGIFWQYYVSNFIFLLTILQRIFIFTLTNNNTKKKHWKSIFNWLIKKKH